MSGIIHILIAGEPNYPQEILVNEQIMAKTSHDLKKFFGRYTKEEEYFNTRPIWKKPSFEMYLFFDGKILL